MNKLITIVELAEATGLSVTTIRRRVAAGTLPYTRANSNRGKLLFDIDIIRQVLQQESYANYKNSIQWEQEQEPETEPKQLSYLASLFKDGDDYKDITPSATFRL